MYQGTTCAPPGSWRGQPPQEPGQGAPSRWVSANQRGEPWPPGTGVPAHRAPWHREAALQPGKEEVSLRPLRRGTGFHTDRGVPGRALRGPGDAKPSPCQVVCLTWQVSLQIWSQSRGLTPQVAPFPSVRPTLGLSFPFCKMGLHWGLGGQARTWHRARAPKATRSAAWRVCFGWGTSPRPQRRQLGHGKSPALSTREPPSLSIPVTFYVPAPRIC